MTAFGRIPLLRFGAPSYETAEGRGRVTWPVDRGLLVARDGRGKGHLRVQVERCDRDGVDDEADAQLDEVRLIARVEVAELLPGPARPRLVLALGGLVLRADAAADPRRSSATRYLRSLADMDFPDVDRTSMPSERDTRPTPLECGRAVSARGERRRPRPAYLIAGATGVIGSRLAAALLADGVARCERSSATRSAAARSSAPTSSCSRRTSTAEPDLDRGDGRRRRRLLPRPHARRAAPATPARERAAAERFAGPRPSAGVGRMVYLGGLGADSGGSPHLDSRHAHRRGPARARPAADLLPRRDGRRPRQRVLRAAALDRGQAPGPAGARAGCARRPSRSGIRDVVAYLRDAPRVPASAGREIQIGGPDVMRAPRRDRAVLAARRAARRRSASPCPTAIASPGVVAAGAAAVTSGTRAVAGELALGLASDTSVSDPSGAALFDDHARAAQRRDPAGAGRGGGGDDG